MAAYLVTGRSGQEEGRIDWTASRNLPTSDPGLAAKIMRATAAQNTRVRNPVYHLALSFDPGDPVDRALMERVADRVASALDLQDHQILIVAHRDRAHPHMHLMINRVHPETGKAWDRWQDQVTVQQVLREEERLLGLREVQGRLSPQQDRTPEHLLPDRIATDQSLLSEDSRAVEQRGELAQAISAQATRGSRVNDLVHALRTYERVRELTKEQYLAQLDVAAARARVAQLDSATEYARVATDAFRRALDRVYREPDSARTAYLAAADERGLSVATRALSEQPEAFGLLRATERTRAFGLLHTPDNLQARAEARAAAMAGCKAVEAERALWGAIAEEHARRTEHAFSKALGAIYDEPVIAQTAFGQLAARYGAEQAVQTLRTRPDELGIVRSSVRAEPERLREYVGQAAARGLEALDAHGFSQLPAPGPHARQLDTEPAIARTEVDRASAAERSVRAELRELPTRRELERRIGYLASRLVPHEFRRFEQAVTAPQLAIALKIKASIRDAVLGKDDERNR